MADEGELGFEVTAGGTSETTAKMGTVKDGLDALEASALSTRNQFLFLSFGVYAMAGIFGNVVKVFGGLKDAIMTTAMATEQQATVISTLTGGMSKDYKTISDEMVRLGVKTQWTALEAGQAMERLAMNGFNLAQTMGAAEMTLNLAAIGMVTTTEAADIAAGTMRAFGLGMETTNEAAGNLTTVVADLTYAVTNSAVTVSDMGEALKYTGAIAQQLGIELESITAFLMIGANSMIKGGLAGRSLRVSLLRIAKATGQLNDDYGNASETMANYNINFLDSAGNMKDMAGIIDELNSKLGDLTEVQKQAALASIFEAQAVPLITANMTAGGDAIREYQYEMKVASARSTLAAKIKEDEVTVFKTWIGQMEDGVSVVDFLVKHQGFSVEQAIDMNEVLIEGQKVMAKNNWTVEQWVDSLKEFTSVQQMVEERLKTMAGTTEMLTSSIDALYQRLGSKMTPLFVQWNNLLKIFIDFMAMLPGPLQAAIALFIILAATFGDLWFKTLMLFAALVMMIAAFKALGVTVKDTLRSSAGLQLAFSNLAKEAWALNAALFRLTFSTLRTMGSFLLPIAIIIIAIDHIMVHWGDTTAMLIGTILILVSALWLYISAVRFSKTVLGQEIIATLRSAWARVFKTKVTEEDTGVTIVGTIAEASYYDTEVFGMGVQKASLIVRWRLIWAKLADLKVTIVSTLAKWKKIFVDNLEKIGLYMQIFLTGFLTGELWANIAATYAQAGANMTLAGTIFAIGQAIRVALPWLALIGLALGAVMLASSKSGDQVVEDYRDSRVPDAFKSGRKHIKSTLEGLKSDIGMTLTPTGINAAQPSVLAPTRSVTNNGKTTVISPQTSISFGNITLSGDQASLEKMKKMIKEGVEEGQRKMIRIIEKDYLAEETGSI